MFDSRLFHIGRVALAIVALAACSDNPRNQKLLSFPSAPFLWSGYVVNPNEAVTLNVKDQSDGTWHPLIQTTSSSSGQSDGTLTWFSFSTGAPVLPYGVSSARTKFWKMLSNQGTQRRMGADLVSSSPTRGDLTTFELNADSCINAQTSGLNIATNCKSPSSPTVTVIANCGKADQACCFARKVGAVDYCDKGRNCDYSTVTCATPAGGLHQACYPNGGCDDPTNQCVEGICRDMIQRAPVLTSKVVVHTCDKADAGTNEEIWIRLHDQTFYLDHPGSDAARNQTDSWGLLIPDVKSVSDISNLTIGTARGQDPWCIDKVTLFVNGTQVFTKSFSGGIWMQAGTDPISGISFLAYVNVADNPTIRNALDAASRAILCGLPGPFPFADLEAVIAGAVGDVFARSRLELDSNDQKFDGSWGSFKPTITKLDDSTLKLAMKVRVTTEGPSFDFTGDFEVRVSASCTMSSEGGGSTFGGQTTFASCTPNFRSNILVTKAIATPDSILIDKDLANWVIHSRLETALNAATAKLPHLDTLFDTAEAKACSSDPNHLLCDPNGNLCSCPSINLTTDPTTGAGSLSLFWAPISSKQNLFCM